jgi:GDP-4-dehydro-6-deoxy-D-mannose reductase
LATFLVENGHSVAGTYVGASPEAPVFEPFVADVADEAAVRRIVEGFLPEAVIHLAGLSHVGASWKQVSDYFRVNVLGTRNVIEAAAGVPVVLASSAEVYGLVPESRQPIVETTPVDPRNPYAMSKAAAELLVLERGGIIVRSFNLIGPGQASTFALPSFARQLAAIASGSHEPVLEVGNLEARRDFLHVDDALQAYWLMVSEGRPGEIYNLGSGRAHSIREVLDMLLEVSGVEAHTVMDPERFRPVDVPMTCGDISKLGDLGWSPQRDVRDALSDLWASVAAR